MNTLLSNNELDEWGVIFREAVVRYLFNKYWSHSFLREMIFDMTQDLAPLWPHTCVSINIPVAGHQEWHNIYQSLSSYSEQWKNLGEYAWEDTFELNLFVNSPEPSSENAYNWDKTLSEVERFRCDYPDIWVNVSARRLPTEYQDIGIIRGIITDLSLMRDTIQSHHIIVSHDADQVCIHPHYIKKIIEIFWNSDVQIFGWKVDDDPTTFLNHPDLFILERLQRFQSKKHINTPGANSAYRASAYMRVGGYGPVEEKCGEDNDLWQRIILNSWDKEKLGYYGWNGRVLRVVTQWRRKVDLLLRYGKIPWRHAWEEIHEDGTSGFVDFGPDDAYRSLNIAPDITKLSSILQDNESWNKFLQIIAPHIFEKIRFHVGDFASAENLAQTLYGTDDEKREEIHCIFRDGIQTLEYDGANTEKIYSSCPLKVIFPLSNFPAPARRALLFLGIGQIECRICFCPDPIGVFVDFQIIKADVLRAGLWKFLDRMKEALKS